MFKDISNDGMFTRQRIQTEGKPPYWIHELKPTFEGQKNSTRRLTLSRSVPDILNRRRLLTQRELDHEGYTEMTGLCHYIRTKYGTLIPFAAVATPQDMQEMGCWKDIQELRKMITHPDFEAQCKAWSKTKHPEQRGRSYDRAATEGRYKRTVQLGSIACKMRPENYKFDAHLSKTGARILKYKFPERNTDTLVRDWACNAAITIGHHDNQELNAIQLNSSSVSVEQDGDLSDDIKQFGGLHIDGGDNPLAFTVMINLSNYPEDYFPGRFNITSVRLTCTLPAGSALVFSGRHPHFGTGGGVYEDSVLRDKNHPLRHRMPRYCELDLLPPENIYLRACGVMYPSLRFTKARMDLINPEMISDQALAVFGTLQNLQEFRLRYFMRKTFEELEDKTQFKRDPGYRTERFEWYNELDDQEIGFGWINEKGTLEFPRRWIAQMVIDYIGKPDPDKDRQLAYHKEVRCGTFFRAQDSMPVGPADPVTTVTNGTADLTLTSDDEPSSTSAGKRAAGTTAAEPPAKKRKTDTQQVVAIPAQAEPEPEKKKKKGKKQLQVKNAARIDVQNPGFEIAYDPSVDFIPNRSLLDQGARVVEEDRMVNWIKNLR
ncbi:hypothetical protein GLAREA_12182 [Glarea lozoyensis ATCC 20868]|uniref:Uncharacterized protein n=2 Tax=Glarea lozoyensis TaxID=101852 RepID=S3D2P2_GLAL2|nr:uncharacterized protein GLAREA_12182 [Glarea lozoyensis ATCC 20868]EHK97590.1 hypothetical protein M7I_6642 [Glarea lozoyensis 74030]EPE32100.1 hypothetical protein GLAREA_12182 [Glarea lozoyensis ATCC 20868]